MEFINNDEGGKEGGGWFGGSEFYGDKTIGSKREEGGSHKVNTNYLHLSLF